MQRHQRVVFSVAFRMLGARADAEDVAQQAFVDAFGALDRFRSDGRKNAFSTWIIRIAINRCKDVLKSKKRTEASLEAEVAGGEAMFAHDTRDPETSLAQERQRRALERALAKCRSSTARCSCSRTSRTLLRGDPRDPRLADHHAQDQRRTRPRHDARAPRTGEPMRDSDERAADDGAESRG